MLEAKPQDTKIKLRPDGWERFERAIDVVIKTRATGYALLPSAINPGRMSVTHDLELQKLLS